MGPYTNINPKLILWGSSLKSSTWYQPPVCTWADKVKRVCVCQALCLKSRRSKMTHFIINIQWWIQDSRAPNMSSSSYWRRAITLLPIEFSSHINFHFLHKAFLFPTCSTPICCFGSSAFHSSLGHALNHQAMASKIEIQLNSDKKPSLSRHHVFIWKGLICSWRVSTLIIELPCKVPYIINKYRTIP